ncbi:DNA binding domain-containing protein, excisionase family [Streptomyces sp. KY75]|nr:DNA binding domain-containing protein, excisionase family [Streptomyces sp. KY75]CAD5975732.1 DNA binding domain-containing protein, excisionase family [Streptomyces sp. KY70]
MDNLAHPGRRLVAVPSTARPAPLEETYLNVKALAKLLGTTERFPRRLVAERRIRYLKVGTHVRFPASAVEEFLATNTVEPIRPRRRMRRAA